MLPEAFWRGKRSSAAMQIGGFLDKDFGLLNKRSRSSFSMQLSQTSNNFLTPPSHQNPLHEDIPLGLELKKSPSFLELIQTRISRDNTSFSAALGALGIDYTSCSTSLGALGIDYTSCSASLGSNNTSCSAALGNNNTSCSAALGNNNTSCSAALGNNNTSGSAALGNNNTSCSAALDKKKDKKFKASNFAASRLRIGSWEFITKNAGTGLTVKFYFAKHKLVWEVLDGGLKYKIEIEWSDITALKADCPKKEPGILTIVLGKQPLFFKETDPMPKKHTLWHASRDFTGGEASTHRQHLLEFPQGVLDKHYQKLIQCDPRLGLLSQLPDTILDSPLFVTETSNLAELKDHGVSRSEIARVSPVSGLQDVSPLLNSSNAEHWSSLGILYDDFSKDIRSLMLDTLSCLDHGVNQIETARGFSVSGLQNVASLSTRLFTSSNGEMDNQSPTSVIGTYSEVQSFQNPSNQQQFEMPAIPPSLSSDDLVGHVEHFISEKTTSVDSPSLENTSDVNYDLDELHRILFSDTTTTLDESFLMPRVNSLCNLIQLNQVPDNTPTNRLVDSKRIQDGKLVEHESYPGCELLPENRVQGRDAAAQEMGLNVVTGHKQLRTMSRKDSYGELLHDLPRIASLPQLCHFVG